MSFVEPSATPANWYADPYGRAVQRYWNGAAWTAYVVDANGQQRVDDPAAAAPPTPMPTGTATGHGVVINNVVHVPQQQPLVAINAPGFMGQKSTGVAFALTFFFGPFGMFYSTVSGAVIMIVLSVILVPATLGVAALVLWPISIIWGMAAANTHNQQLMARMTAPQPIHQSAPLLQAAPVYPPPGYQAPPASPVQAALPPPPSGSA